MNDIKKAMLQSRKSKPGDEFVFATMNIIREKERVAEKRRYVMGYVISSVVSLIMFVVSTVLFKDIILSALKPVVGLISEVKISPVYVIVSCAGLFLVFMNYMALKYKLHKKSIS